MPAAFILGEIDLSRKSRILVKTIEKGSIAEEIGIEAGDTLLSINGQKIGDIFDYRYLSTEESLSIQIEKMDGEIWDIDVEKEQYDDLGMEFEDPLMDGSKSCTNKCIFCFIDQLPKGMRNTVYFKDDDSRLSFLSGNYVTLTNMKNSDLDRIIRYRMSPINISVHAADPDVRRFMLGNRFAGDVIAKIKRLVNGGITVNTQIVLCRGINDGRELDRTISELSELFPQMASISVVPVGITKWRQDLFELQPFDSAASLSVVEQVEGWQRKLLDKTGSRVVYIADEFYIMAGRELPPCSTYEDFPQIENGVGLVSLLLEEFHEALKDKNQHAEVKCASVPERHVSIATGMSVCKYIKGMAQELEKRYNKLKVSVYPIKNNYFGENVTVTGLLVGSDIAEQLMDEDKGCELLISRSMLKADEDVFLDDYTVGLLQEKLCTKVVIVENSGDDFINKVLGQYGG